MKRNLVSHEISEQLNEDSGLRDITGSPLTVMEALRKGIIDTESGQVSAM